MKYLPLEFSKGMILPKKDNDNSSSKPALSKESIKNTHNSDNVSYKNN